MLLEDYENQKNLTIVYDNQNNYEKNRIRLKNNGNHEHQQMLCKKPENYANL